MQRKQDESNFDDELVVSSPRGVDRRPYSLKVGDTVSGFNLQSIDEINDFKITAYSLEHEKTKARYLHLDSSDLENVFTVRFKTPPTNSKGVPHILEHMALCGSKNYPVRDPFFNMAKRSLNTFMNAWTGSDFTMYPFSTCNEKDYENLLRIYLDAAFFPLLKQTDFRQEGYRYEFEKWNDPKSPLTIKGVVYNEMKGHMSNANMLWLHKINEHLFERSCYHYNNGGDPVEIPLLSYQELAEFQQRLYHPSNSMFMSYGDLDFTKYLEIIERQALQHFEFKDVGVSINEEPRFAEPKTVTEYFMPELNEDTESQGRFGYTFLCNDVVKDSYESFCLHIMSNLMFDGPASAFYKNIIEAGVAPAFASGVGYDMTTKEGTFGIGVSNIKINKENIGKVEKAIQDTLEQLIKEGIPEDQFEAQLHSLELRIKKTRNHWGLMTISNMTSYTLYDGNPLDVFKFNEYSERIRKDYKNGIFEELIQKYLIGNQHKLILKMIPDESLTQKQQLEELTMIKAVESALSQEDKERLVQEALELQKDQETVQDIDLLPTLTLNDIPTKIEYVEHNKSMLYDSMPVYWFNQPTNGLTHLRIKIDISKLPEDKKMLIPLFCNFISEVGTKNYDYKKFHTLMNMTTSGLQGDNNSFVLSADLDESNDQVMLSVAFLDRNTNQAMSYISELLSTPNFDDSSHLSDLVKTSSVKIANNIGNNSLNYGISYANSGLRKYALNSESLTSDLFTCQLGTEVLKTSNPKVIYNDLIINLTDLASHLFREENMSFAVTGDQQRFELMNLKLEMLVNAIRNENSLAQERLNSSYGIDTSPFETVYHKNFFETPLQVNNCVESFLGPGYYDENYGHALVTANLLRNEFCLPIIREKGGAYGAGASANENGIFSFFSFWDPKLEQTFENFELCLQKVCDKEFDEKQLDQAKLSAFQKLDKVVEPSLKGMLFFTRGYTDEQKNKVR